MRTTKPIFYAFVLSITGTLVSGVMGYYTLAQIGLGATMLSGFTGFGLVCHHSYHLASRSLRKLKAEGRRTYSSINLFYRLETHRIYRGVAQYADCEKKSRTLLRLIRRRFAEHSLTRIRFQQEVDAYVRHIMLNLEQLALLEESRSQINPNRRLSPTQQPKVAGSDRHHSVLLPQPGQYETLGEQCQELLARNEQLLAEMDQAIIAMSQKNYRRNADDQGRYLIGEEAFMRRYLTR